MNTRNSWFWSVGRAVVLASAVMIVATPAYSTENATERRGARDTKQNARQGARTEKVDCRQANNKSNAECRQDKRSTKQTGRQDSRDVRSGQPPAPK
jgi:hypothetical protein